ncbi:unnamed protein product [Caenorhabditis bovis]|uniref:3-hydroxy-3-methylglutaryl coenzyme A reductase n=1 Tax=Caenorhabditis bovis TaxID=2654633 RepID=A0A8S1EQG7_9PELO|nr:unnamed protein product [Caenorhabditis bovis]
MPDVSVAKLMEFVDGAQFDDSEWRQKIRDFVVSQQASSVKTTRTPLFSVGEDDLSDEASNRVVETKDVGIQCAVDEDVEISSGNRCFDKIKEDWKNKKRVTPGEALRLLKQNEIKHRELEYNLQGVDAIAVRRAFLKIALPQLPFKNYDYQLVTNCCCENVIGYIPVPVGLAGPLHLNDKNDIYVPMATTEGALIASTNRGMSAIRLAGGVQATVFAHGMSRAPVVKLKTAVEAVKFKRWVEEHMEKVRCEFESTSRYARLTSVDITVDGNLVFLRFVAGTGDAMGMNMISKGCHQAMNYIARKYPNMEVVSLSGNYCVDKKAAAINWTQGRGRSVVADCVIPNRVVAKILKTTPASIAAAATAKLQVGSSRAGSIGGSNAHAANIVAAIFIATGQDAAQVVSSSMCSTRMEVDDNGDLYVSCTLPCVEVGTVGGGTVLGPQGECLKLLNCLGSSPIYGRNGDTLAEVIAGTVLAAEISLMAALVTDDLVSSHMKLNRSKIQLYDNANERSKLDEDIEKAEHLKIGKGNIKLKRMPQEMVQCSNIL